MNSNDKWTVVGNPFNKAAGTISIDDSRDAGVVHLATYPKGGAYADAGVIVSLGTVGENFDDKGMFKMPNVKGPYTDQVAVNLYVDVSGNGGYFAFDEDGVFEGLDGDKVLYSVSDKTTRSEVGADDETALWAWVGVSGKDVQTAALTRFAGNDLAVC